MRESCALGRQHMRHYVRSAGVVSKLKLKSLINPRPQQGNPDHEVLAYKQVFRFFHQRIVEVFIVECVKFSRLVISKRNVQTMSFLDPKLLPEIVSPGLPPVSNRWLISIGPPAVDCQQ